MKHKFHADDMDLMWSRVAKACDPNGEGLYDVEYRVRQLDGSWRWLSAWGYVAFEGEGDSRKPVAITGARRDISEMVQATEAQKLLINELNHRVKNMLATVQSIAMQTQRSTPDAFGVRFEERLMALSRAHDLLFSGDLFASYFFNAHFPPPILNSAPDLIPASLEKARRLNPRLMVPQHYDVLDGALHRRRFDRLIAKQLRTKAVAAE